MLILSRKLNESIVIDGRITVKVLRIDGEVIKLGITAPADVPVHRQEVYEEIRQSNQAAAAPHLGPVPKLSTRQRGSPAALPLPLPAGRLPAKP
ncbi:MAG: carbon storage regulator CsrA [Verrucomicrobiota bacterium]|jgi:carbon storage regulator